MLGNFETRLDADGMARALRAVADPARVRLLRLCADRPTSVSELAAATSDSEPNVSRHLKQLALVGLLRRVRRGQRVEYLPVSEAGFAADLLGLLLQRFSSDDAGLREARAHVAGLLDDTAPRDWAFFVRVNALDSGLTLADMAAAIRA